jgi:transcriptional regulator of acetoin/glycerol metabolism
MKGVLDMNNDNNNNNEKNLTPLKKLEKMAILEALRVTKGNISQAAQALAIGRATLYRKLRKYNIDGN